MRLSHLGQNRNCQQACRGFWYGIHTRVLTCWKEILVDRVFTKNAINIRSWGPFLPEALQQDASSRSSCQPWTFEISDLSHHSGHSWTDRPVKNVWKYFVAKKLLQITKQALFRPKIEKNIALHAQLMLGVVRVNKILNCAQNQNARCQRQV